MENTHFVLPPLGVRYLVHVHNLLPKPTYLVSSFFGFCSIKIYEGQLQYIAQRSEIKFLGLGSGKFVAEVAEAFCGTCKVSRAI